MSPHELEAWLGRLHQESFGWALSCCAGDHARAEDVLQTTYVRVLSGVAVFGGRSLFRTWLFGVIRRVAMEEQRRWHKTEARTLQLEDAAPQQLADQQQAVDENDDVHALQRALGQLAERQREVLHLVFYQDMTIAQAAELMNISVGSARTHYERGKVRLRALLEGTSDERPAAGR